MHRGRPTTLRKSVFIFAFLTCVTVAYFKYTEDASFGSIANPSEKKEIDKLNTSLREPDGKLCPALDGYEAIDRSPIRSPLVVAEHLIKHAHGKVLLEVGTRNGDILACVSRFASKVLAVEIDKVYCDRLTGRGLEVLCDDYTKVVLSKLPSMPQVFFWWPMVASHQNEQWLGHTRDQLSCSGMQPVVIIAFDNQWEPDIENKVVMLQKHPTAQEYVIPFNEGTEDRTHGTFSLLHFNPCNL